MGVDPRGDGGDKSPPTSEKHEVVAPNSFKIITSFYTFNRSLLHV
jgi:hypothetical protein